MSQLNVNTIKNRTGKGGISLPLGADSAGIVTATSLDSRQLIGDVNVGGAVTISGNLTVDGTQTIINTSSLEVEDKTVGVGSTSNPSDASANGAGLVVYGSTEKSLKWGTSGYKWTLEGGGLQAQDVSVTGVVTATSFKGDGSTLSGIEAAPTIQLVADGAVPANTSVIVTNTGKAKTILGFDEAFGSPIQVAGTTASTQQYSQIAEDTSTGRVVYLYRNNAVSPNSTHYIVGTRSGNSITWGTPATLCGNPCDGEKCQIVCIGTDKFFAIYRDWENHYYTRVISTSSSNSATLGTRIVVTDSSNNNVSDILLPQLQYNSTTGAIIACYGQNSGSNQGVIARMYTVSGTTITRGAPHRVNSNLPETLDSCWLQYVKSMAIVFRWNNNQFNSAIIKEPDSGTTLDSLVINVTSTTGGNHMIAFDTVNQVLFAAFQRSSDNEWQYYGGKWAAGGTSGDINWYGSARTVYVGGSPVSGSSWHYGQFIYQEDVGKFLLVLQDSSSDGWATTFIPSTGGNLGTNQQELTASPNSMTEFNTDFAQSKYLMKAGANGAVLIPYLEAGTANQKVIVKQYASTTLTTGNFVGFSDGTSYSDGQTVKIHVVGNTTTQSSLTPGSLYYVQADGTLGTTAGDPSVVAGKAISATSLLIQPA